MAAIRLNPDNAALARIGIELVARRDWDGLKAQVQALPPESAYTFLRLLGEKAPFDLDVREASLHDRDSLGLTIAGALLQGRATRYRGLADASQVSEQQWENYFPVLFEAEESSAAANEIFPQSGLAAAWRMTAAVDSGEEEKDAAEAALLVAREVPVSGFARLLSARTEKWGGSHAAMWKVARTHAERDPPGTLGLIAKAHFEQWLYFSVFDESGQGADRAKTYFQRPEVRAELEEASRRVLSIPDHPDPRNSLYAHNCFACTFHIAGARGWARPHLARIGKHVDPAIWLFGRPRLELNLARLKSGLLPV
jgi:hypothetical protein